MSAVRVWLVAALLSSAPAPGFSESYRSPGIQFAVEVNSPWERVTTPDPTVELFFGCAIADACGDGSTVSFGGFFDAALKTGTVDEFLRHASGKTITQSLRTSPLVQKLKIVREGRTRLGDSAAYEVLSEMLLRDGRARMRHTFMTFRAGYVYSVSIGSAPPSYERALQAAQPALNSFRISAR